MFKVVMVLAVGSLLGSASFAGGPRCPKGECFVGFPEVCVPCDQVKSFLGQLPLKPVSSIPASQMVSIRK